MGISVIRRMLSMTTDFITHYGLILAGTVGFLALLKTVTEFAKRGAANRAAPFVEMRARLDKDPMLKEICILLEHNDPKLCKMPFSEKRAFLGLFQQAALALNSGVIKPGTAYALFGHFVIRCVDSDHFWGGVDRLNPEWALFTDFARQMNLWDKTGSFRRGDYRF
jgi:hypothetical protein